ncbi:hypothetical protein GCM10009504_05960 [Pseudomonas laurentiana]|nr:hypothetical protein GCM10009504_05960 [Pseudomonas laurentiana]
MLSAASASLKCSIVTLGSLIHIPPFPGWNTKGLDGVADVWRSGDREHERAEVDRGWPDQQLQRYCPHYRDLLELPDFGPVSQDKLALLLLTCGCQSYSPAPPPPRVVAVGGEKPPAPAAWFMEARESNLTQRMLNELSASPVAATKD